MSEGPAKRNGTIKVCSCHGYTSSNTLLSIFPSLMYSNNSDAEILIPQFLSGVNVLCELYVPPAVVSPSEMSSAISTSGHTHHRNRSNTSVDGLSPRSPPVTPSYSRSGSFSLPQAEHHRHKLCYVDILKVLEPVWGTIDSWFDLLGEEIERADFKQPKG